MPDVYDGGFCTGNSPSRKAPSWLYDRVLDTSLCKVGVGFYLSNLILDVTNINSKLNFAV